MRVSQLLQEYLDECETGKPIIPTLPGFYGFCLTNNVEYTKEDIKCLRILSEKAIIEYADRSNSPKLKETIFSKLLDKFHNYKTEEKDESINPITIVFGEAPVIPEGTRTAKDEFDEIVNSLQEPDENLD